MLVRTFSHEVVTPATCYYDENSNTLYNGENLLNICITQIDHFYSSRSYINITPRVIAIFSKQYHYTEFYYYSHVDLSPHDDWDPQSNFEPAGSGPITMGSISKCAPFWKNFVKNKRVMKWVNEGYDLVWVTTPPIAREMPNSKSTLENREFVTKAISDIIEAGATSALPTGVIPTVVNLFGVVPKPHSEKLRLIVNTRYVNNILVKRVFKFEGLSDIADMANKGD